MSNFHFNLISISKFLSDPHYTLTFSNFLQNSRTSLFDDD